MGRMADSVLKEMDMKQKEEEEKVRKYELDKELRDRLEDERRIRRLKEK
jgi:hypothetical protein